jgi:hypothetical protein
MSISGGYVRYNPNYNDSLGAFLTGTTLAWYIMPGWEVEYLYCGKENYEKTPIALGDAFHEYAIVGKSQSEILTFLQDHGRQKVKLATYNWAADGGNATHGYTDGAVVPTGIKSSFLTATFCQVAKPPTTLIRESLMKDGLLLVGIGGGAFAAAKTMWDLADFAGSALGLSPTDKLMASRNDGKNVVLLLNPMDDTPHKYNLTWTKIPFSVNQAVRFDQIANAVKNLGVAPLNPLLQAAKKQAKSAVSNPVKKTGFLKNVGAKVGKMNLDALIWGSMSKY